MITTLAGENAVARGQELSRLVSAFEREHGDMAVERLDGEEASYERTLEAAQTLPFLASRKLVVLRAPGANKEFAEKFEDFVKNMADTTDIIINEPKLDKRLSYYKQLKKLTDFKDFVVLDASGLTRFAAAYANEQGGALAAGNARFLVERVGTDQSTVQNELDKLLAYDPKITRASIELLTEKTPQSSVFELLEAAFAGNAKRTAELYAEQRALKVEPQQIIAMLAWQLHVLALVLTAKGRTAEVIAREARLNPYVVRKSQGLASRLTFTRLKELVASLRELDVRTKTEGIIPDEAVQYYLLQLSCD